MKKYKFLSNNLASKITSKVNKFIKQGWKLVEWKVNNNVIVALLEKEVLYEKETS